MTLLLQLLSVLGAILILGAFYSVQRGWWTSTTMGYLWLNFVGATILMAVAVVDRRVGFVLLEGAWAAVSIMAIVRSGRRGSRTTEARRVTR